MGFAVRFSNVSKYYAQFRRNPLRVIFPHEDDSQRILGVRDVTLEIGRGEIFGLVGRNGQGKTTLVKCLAGLIEPTQGTIEIFDGSRYAIGLVSSDERSFYWRLTGWQNLLFFSRLHGIPDSQARKIIEPLLEHFQLQALAQRRFDGYSAGNKQRLAIIRALLNDPKLLVLDEPTRSLDPIAADALRSLIVDWKKAHPDRTAIITSHNLGEIEELCDRVGILSRNTLAECATMDSLRERYPAHDRVTIHARCQNGRKDWSALRERIAGLCATPLDEGLWQLEFNHRNGEINEVLADLMRNGDEVLSCNMVRVGLREIMERVDGGD